MALIQLIPISRACSSSALNFQRCVQSLVPIKDSTQEAHRHAESIRVPFATKVDSFFPQNMNTWKIDWKCPFQRFLQEELSICGSFREPLAVSTTRIHNGWLISSRHEGIILNSPAKMPQLPKWFCIAWKTDSSVTWNWFITKVSDKICPYLKGPLVAYCACWGSATRYSIKQKVTFPTKTK